MHYFAYKNDLLETGSIETEKAEKEYVFWFKCYSQYTIWINNEVFLQNKGTRTGCVLFNELSTRCVHFHIRTLNSSYFPFFAKTKNLTFILNSKYSNYIFTYLTNFKVKN